MKQVKIFSGNNTQKVEDQVNAWLAYEKGTIVETRIAREYIGRMNDVESITTIMVTYIKHNESDQL